MTNNINTIYNQELEKIIKNSNTISVFLVGSSKYANFNSQNISINDIDIFVFVNQGEDQVRIIKEIEGIEFDINYFSRNGFKKLIDNKEYFFLKEMKDAVVVYDKHSTGINIITSCKRKYLEGPNRLSDDEKQFIKADINSKISRLKNKEEYDGFEYDFLSKIYLKDLLIAYFSVNDKWTPKDKKLLKTVKQEDKILYSLVNEYYNDTNYENITKIYDYVFKDLDNSKSIKLTY